MTDEAQQEKPGWRPVKVETQFVVKGGMCNKPHVLETMEVTSAAGVQHFCRVVKSEVWLLKCGAGTAAQKGILERSQIAEKLKNKLHDMSRNTEQAAVAALSAEDEAAVAADDPMRMLGDIEKDDSQPASKKTKYSPKRMCNRVFRIEMPNMPPEAGDPAVAGNRMISVLGKSTNQLWIGVEDVEWLINYVAKEVALGGVPVEEESAVAEGNCEVPNLRVRWDFGNKSWRADFVAGKLQYKSFTSGVANMNAEKWASVATAVAVEFGEATFENLKEGTRLLLQAHCAKLLHDTDT